MSKHFLSVGAIFKNEAHILREWIEHYLAEGVEHFYLINNDSTDDYEAVLRPYVARGLITLIYDARPMLQRHYSDYLVDVRFETEWMLVCDLDEFVYTKEGTIRRFIEEFAKPPINAIVLPWLCFGSAGHFKQPESVVRAFTKRRRYSLPNQGEKCFCKEIVRMADVEHFDVHQHTLIFKKQIDGCGNRVETVGVLDIDEEFIGKAKILLNHYRVQSEEWFKTVKMTRGDVYYGQHDIKVDDYFNGFNFNDVQDSTLAEKRGLCPKGEKG